MGQHKNTTERNFRDKLNEREIMPSANAWDRLDAMLTVAEEKKSRRGYGWLYIAASISGFLLIGTVFLSQTEQVIDQGRQNEVVFDEQVQSAAAAEETFPSGSDAGAMAATENPTKATTNSRYDHRPSQHGELAQRSKSINNNQSTTTIINQNSVEAVNQVPDHQKLIASANQPEAQPTRSTRSEKIIHQKTDQLSVKVDELLAAAQSGNAHPKTSVKVNSKSLLSEVDQQVNLTFREKMLRRASEVAETVANRNNE